MDQPTISSDFGATVSFEGVDASGVITVVTPASIVGGTTVFFRLTPHPTNGFTVFPLDATTRDLNANVDDIRIRPDSGSSWTPNTTYKWAYRQRYNV